jgi:hypothetical protein
MLTDEISRLLYAAVQKYRKPGHCGNLSFYGGA